MFTRTDALKAITEKFPKTETRTQKDYINGGTKDFTVSPEWRLGKMIDLHEPVYDGLKEGGEGLQNATKDHFLASVEHDYKNENGLW
jgi:hypothetical protein